MLFIWENNETMLWTKSPKIKRDSRRDSISITSYDLIHQRPLSQGPAEVGSILPPPVRRFITIMWIPTMLICIYRSICIQRLNSLFKPLKSTLLNIPSYYWGLSTLESKKEYLYFYHWTGLYFEEESESFSFIIWLRDLNNKDCLYIFFSCWINHSSSHIHGKTVLLAP